MIVHFVGAGSGDPELLTRKAERLLAACRICIYAGSLVSPGVLALLPDRAERHDSAGMSLEEVIAACRNALDALGIPYDVCPGVSAFQAAAAALCTELTAPEVSQTIVLTRTAGRTPLPEAQELDRIARTRATLCIFLSVGKIAEVAVTLSAHYGPDCPAAVVYRASLREFSHSDFVAEKVNLPAVAEPTALLAGMKTRFICRKKTTSGITIALAREGFPWSESSSAVRYTRCASD